MVDAAMLFPDFFELDFRWCKSHTDRAGNGRLEMRAPGTPEKLIAVSLFERRSEDGAEPFHSMRNTQRIGGKGADDG